MTEYRGWIPKLTPAKLRALAKLVAADPDPRRRPQGLKCKGVILTSCHALEHMGLVDLRTGSRADYVITPAGRKALANPSSYKPKEPVRFSGPLITEWSR